MLYVVVKNLSTNTQHTEKVIKEVCCETFGETIQFTMEYNERDVSDDEQIVEEDEHEESEDKEDDESEDEENVEPEEEEDEEPEGGDDEEKNPWVGIREQVEERQGKT